MPVGIGYENNQVRVPEQNRSPRNERPEPARRDEQTRELDSSSTSNEQRARDRAAQNNGLLATPEETVVRPNEQTITQLQSNQQSQMPSNASGLGRTAVQSYQSLDNAEFSENMRNNVRVDVSA